VPEFPYIQIDLKALQHNLKQVKSFAPNSKIFAVIKANAYGHGVVEAANALHEADAFAVARVGEAVQLREAGIDKTIILLEGVRNQHELLQASTYQLSPVFHSEHQLTELENSTLPQPLTHCWLMVETGMHRLGVKPESVDLTLERLNQTSNIKGDIGLMSHFANSDSVDDLRNQQQLQQILDISADNIVSMANSGGIIAIPDSHQDWVRPGIMLYGSSPFPDKSAAELGLKPVMTFKSQITAIQQLKQGDQVGYGGDFIALEAMTVATVSGGYGDGYHRSLAEKGYVAIDGKLAKVVGRVSMDMICIDVSDFTDITIGDEVVLWGNELVPIDTVANWANTISYELLCLVTERVTRIYG